MHVNAKEKLNVCISAVNAAIAREVFRPSKKFLFAEKIIKKSRMREFFGEFPQLPLNEFL